jgi:hypothetical protein
MQPLMWYLLRLSASCQTLPARASRAWASVLRLGGLAIAWNRRTLRCQSRPGPTRRKRRAGLVDLLVADAKIVALAPTRPRWHRGAATFVVAEVE